MPPLSQKLYPWETWLGQGLDYEKAAGGRSDKPSPFSPAIQYNLIALALEGGVGISMKN